MMYFFFRSFWFCVFYLCVGVLSAQQVATVKGRITAGKEPVVGAVVQLKARISKTACSISPIRAIRYAIMVVVGMWLPLTSSRQCLQLMLSPIYNGRFLSIPRKTMVPYSLSVIWICSVHSLPRCSLIAMI